MRRVISAFHALISASIVRAKEAAASARAYAPPGSILCVGIPYFEPGLFLGGALEKKREGRTCFFPNSVRGPVLRLTPFFVDPICTRTPTYRAGYVSGKGKDIFLKKKNLHSFSLVPLGVSCRAGKKDKSTNSNAPARRSFSFCIKAKRKKRQTKNGRAVVLPCTIGSRGGRPRQKKGLGKGRNQWISLRMR